MVIEPKDPQLISLFNWKGTFKGLRAILAELIEKVRDNAKNP